MPENKFKEDYGFQEHHTIPIVGYGITIETIQHFLAENEEPTNQLDDVEEYEVNEALPQYTDHGYSYVTMATGEQRFLLHYPTNFSLNETNLDTVPSEKEIKENIYKMALKIFKPRPTLNLSFKLYIYDHIDYIATADFS